MKKIIYIKILSLFFLCGFSYAQYWQENEFGDIFNNNETRKVGIGTSYPGELLDVAGNLKLSNSGILKVDGTSNSYIMGSLGLGTVTPSVSLHIVNNNVTKLQLQGGSLNRILFADGSSNVSWMDINSGSSGYFDFYKGGSLMKIFNSGGIEIYEPSSGKMLLLGYYGPGNYGYISAYDGVQGSNLIIGSPTSGSVGIGTLTPDPAYKLSVNGKIRTKELRVETGWSDYVFKEDYNLKPIEEVESFIKENGHLPDIPSEKEVVENGVELGNMTSKLLAKIEELTLYVIDINKQLETLKKENEDMKILLKK